MPKKIAIVATASASGEKGGAERFYEGLKSALCAQGVDAEIVAAIPDESSFEGILGSYLRFYDLDLDWIRRHYFDQGARLPGAASQPCLLSVAHDAQVLRHVRH